MSCSPPFRWLVQGRLAIAGAFEAGQMSAISTQFKSALYLCIDNDTDRAVQGGGGFDDVSVALMGNANHIAYDPSTHDPSSHLYSIKAIQDYLKYQNALDSMERPTVIICKSSRRAGAVASAYMSIKGKKTLSTTIDEASKADLSYLEDDKMKTWVTVVVNALSPSTKNALIHRQWFERTSSTYSYLLADARTKDAVLIDPVLETVERDARIIKEMDLNLKYCLNTHVHADHITGSGMLKKHFPQCKSVLSTPSTGKADILVNEGDNVVFGTRSLLCVSTPGHTTGCFTYVLDDFSNAYTGDTLLIRGCGRTDFQGGSAEQLYESVHSKIFQLPDECNVYPAHDYKGYNVSTIEEEKEHNPRLTKPLEEFKDIMDNLNLPYPAKIDASLPANLECGLQHLPEGYSM